MRGGALFGDAVREGGDVDAAVRTGDAEVAGMVADADVVAMGAEGADAESRVLAHPDAQTNTSANNAMRLRLTDGCPSTGSR